MTVPPDPDEPPPRLLSPAFWTMIAFSAICVAAGVGLAAFGPRLLAQRAEPTAASAAPEPRVSAPAPGERDVR
jgi:hypothetical protein